MKKKVFLVLVLALIVAGGAFAQRVGDNVQVMGQSYRVQEAANGRLVLQLVPSLDGVWVTPNGNVYTQNGSTCVITQIGANSALWQDAVSKGYLKVGDQVRRNFRSTGSLTWTGQYLGVTYNNNAPNVATGTSWFDTTLTMSADGLSYVSSATNTTYTRRQ